MIESPIDLQLQDIRLMNKIGEGGMSCVWKAMDLARNAVVAVKILKPDLTCNVEDLEQFKAEEKAIRDAMALCKGNLTLVAKELGISRPTLYSKLKQYDI